MKKVLLSLAIVSIVSLSAKAQKSSSTDGQIKLDIGIKGGLPIGDFSNISSFGIGGFVKAAYPVSSDFDLTGTVGYTSFIGKTVDGFKYPSEGLFDVIVGGSYKLDGGFHLDGGIGYGTFSPGSGGFAYRVGAGYQVTPDLDITANYNGISDGGTLSYIGIGVSYAIIK